MNKHLLLLTAATAALLVGPAFAAGSSTTGCDTADDNTDVTTKITTPLCTKSVKKGKAGDITIESTGSLVIASSSTAATIPAITIDSNNTVTLDTGSSVTFKGTDSAIGIELKAGHTGGLDDSATIDLSGSGTTKNGILLTGKGTFSGDIKLKSGSTLTVQGDSSNGIDIADTATLAGNILVNGSVTVSTSNATSTTAPDPAVIGLNIGGDVTGNVTIQGGAVTALGAGSEGLLLTGHIGGGLRLDNSVSAVGTSTPKKSQSNPEAGSALAIGGSIGGGILINGPKGAGDTTTLTASITTSGTAPAVEISPVFDTTAHDINIGLVSSDKYSFVNHGTISDAPMDPNLSAVGGLVIAGIAGHTVTFAGGILNTGTVQASAASSTVSGSTAVNATGLQIGTNATVPSLINSSQSGLGNITAAISGASGGNATAISILGATGGVSGGSLVSITNEGTIRASASTSAAAVTALSAFAIDDQSGTLTSITNSGTIAATATSLAAANQIAVAADLSANTTGVTFKNTGTVTGDIRFGSGGDKLSVKGSNSVTASVNGDISFGGGSVAHPDVLVVNAFGSVTGAITEDPSRPNLDITVDNNGTLDMTNETQGVSMNNLVVAKGGAFDLTVSQAFDKNAGPDVFVGPLIRANSAVIDARNMNISYGSFLSPTNGLNQEQFVLIQAPDGDLTIKGLDVLQSKFTLPFLYDKGDNGGLALVKNATSIMGKSYDELVLSLKLKSAKELGLTGYAAQLYGTNEAGPALLALANDAELGGAIVSGVTDKASAQSAFESFAPNISGETRAMAISLTDQATGPVAARQRELRMYANQDSDATLWSQQFGEALNQDGTSVGPGFRNSGFGFVMGMDGGSPGAGRYGGAFTFFSGSAHEKNPRHSKTVENWYMATGYTDWRGRGFFLDSQATVGIATVDGKRFLDVGDVSRTAEGKRNALAGALGVTTGVVFNWGGTVLTPQMSLDGLSMREEGYKETGGGDGFDLHVYPYYANSLRGFAGIDLRQDVKLADFYFQPELRGGYRYDFLNGAAKTKAFFAGDPNGSPAVAAGPDFTMTGPEPTRGNFVAGASLATTTDTWSIGVNYDVLRGSNGDFSQTGTISLIGKI